MSILVVGSIALDSVETPFGKTEEALGGSATFFSLSASYFVPVNLVAIVGEDLPKEHMQLLQRHGIDTRGVEIAKGKTFRWKGRYGYDLSNPETVYTHLNVFENYTPKIPPEYKRSDVVFLANIDPGLQSYILNQVERPRLVACDTMNYWIKNKKRGQDLQG